MNWCGAAGFALPMTVVADTVKHVCSPVLLHSANSRPGTTRNRVASSFNNRSTWKGQLHLSPCPLLAGRGFNSPRRLARCGAMNARREGASGSHRTSTRTRLSVLFGQRAPSGSADCSTCRISTGLPKASRRADRCGAGASRRSIGITAPTAGSRGGASCGNLLRDGPCTAIALSLRRTEALAEADAAAARSEQVTQRARPTWRRRSV